MGYGKTFYNFLSPIFPSPQTTPFYCPFCQDGLGSRLVDAISDSGSVNPGFANMNCASGGQGAQVAVPATSLRGFYYALLLHETVSVPYISPAQ